jgi:hypothetical protein
MQDPSRVVMRLKLHSKFPPRLAFSAAMDLAFSPEGRLVAGPNSGPRRG